MRRVLRVYSTQSATNVAFRNAQGKHVFSRKEVEHGEEITTFLCIKSLKDLERLKGRLWHEIHITESVPGHLCPFILGHKDKR